MHGIQPPDATLCRAHRLTSGPATRCPDVRAARVWASRTRISGTRWSWVLILMSLRCALASHKHHLCSCHTMTRALHGLTRCTVQATSDSSAVLLQLPHMSVEVLRKIVRKRIRTLPDLLQLSSQELDELLTSSGERPVQRLSTEGLRGSLT